MTGPGQKMDRDDLLDALAELQHDLGKYLVMPVAFLPTDAEAVAVRAAVRQALFETRRGAGGVRTARSMWMQFVAEVGTNLDDRASTAGLRAAVEAALSWESRLDADFIDRTHVRRDLGAVAESIRALLAEISEEISDER